MSTEASTLDSFHLSKSQITWLVCLLPIYILFIVIYRLYFSPLANVPGDRLAAITSLYAFYYDVCLGGKFIWEVERMHQQYGPIVRIRPNFVHINDPEYIDKIYTSAVRRRDKGSVAINGLAVPGAGLGTKCHDLHKARRAAINPFFSKQSIRRVEPMIQRVLQKVIRWLGKSSSTESIVKLKILAQAATSDIINEYSFGKSTNYLDTKDLNETGFNYMEEAVKGYHLATFLPWLPSLFLLVPPRLLLSTKLRVWVEMMAFLRSRLAEVMSTKGRNESTTIFHGILDSNLPESEKSPERLLDEARAIIAGGTDTTATTLTFITFHLLSNPAMVKRLRAELHTALPDPNTPPSLQQVESLPYLSAIIREAIRLHPAAALRQERTAPDEDLTYTDKSTGKTYFIPRGTILAMTATLLSRNTTLYPSWYEFRPERFLENPRLARYEMSFSRGTRRCLGENLAYAELYLLVAGIFRKYDVWEVGKRGPTLELYETTRERDVDLIGEFIFPAVRGHEGVRVRVRA